MLKFDYKELSFFKANGFLLFLNISHVISKLVILTRLTDDITDIINFHLCIQGFINFLFAYELLCQQWNWWVNVDHTCHSNVLFALLISK